MPTLKQIVEDHDTRLGLAFDIFIGVLIVLTLVAYSVETIPDLDSDTYRYLRYFEYFTISVFAIEYLLRIFVADNKRRFIFSFFGIVDLMAIVPFFVMPGVDMRTLRSLRLMRAFVIFKLVRYSQAVQRFQRALIIAREELILFTVVAAIFLYISAVGIYQFENRVQPDKFSSIFESLWWAVSTLTTVGYGDVVPITVGGKIFTFFILLLGLSVIAVPAGVMATALYQARQQEQGDSVE